MAISAIAYFINTLDSQSPGHDRVRPNYLKVGDLFYKICTSLYANFRKKSHPYVLWKVTNFALIFYVMSVSQKKIKAKFETFHWSYQMRFFFEIWHKLRYIFCKKGPQLSNSLA